MVLTANLSNKASSIGSQLVEIWRVDDSNWRGELEMGSEGLARVKWGADSRHIITVDEFYVRMIGNS